MAETRLGNSSGEHAVVSPTLKRECEDSPRSLISAAQRGNLYLQDVGEHEGGDGQEPKDTVVIPAYDYHVDPAADTWPKVFDRAGVGGRWRRNLSIEP